MHLVRDSQLDHDELIEKMDRILGRNR
jgi:hypothetical protein